MRRTTLIPARALASYRGRWEIVDRAPVAPHGPNAHREIRSRCAGSVSPDGRLDVSPDGLVDALIGGGGINAAVDRLRDLLADGTVGASDFPTPAVLVNTDAVVVVADVDRHVAVVEAWRPADLAEAPSAMPDLIARRGLAEVMAALVEAQEAELAAARAAVWDRFQARRLREAV